MRAPIRVLGFIQLVTTTNNLQFLCRQVQHCDGDLVAVEVVRAHSIILYPIVSMPLVDNEGPPGNETYGFKCYDGN